MLRAGKELNPPTHIFLLIDSFYVFHSHATFPPQNTFLSLQENILILSHIFTLFFDELECWQTKMCQEKDNYHVKGQSIIMYEEQKKGQRVFTL